MNIFDLRINKQALSEMAVLHPITGEPTGMVVSVRSVDHPKVQVALVAFNKAKGDDAKELTIEEQLAANADSALELAVAMTDSWTVVGADGKIAWIGHAGLLDETVGQLVVATHIFDAASHETLDRSDRVLWIQCQGCLCIKANLATASGHIAHHRRQDSTPLIIRKAFSHAMAH